MILFYFCQISMCVCVCVCVCIFFGAVYSHEYRRLIKELYYPCGVYPDLAKSAKSSYGWSSLKLHEKFIKKDPVSRNITPPFKQPCSGEIPPKRKPHSRFKIGNIKCFWNFPITRSEEKKEEVKITRFSILGLLMCSQQVSIFWLSRYWWPYFHDKGFL